MIEAAREVIIDLFRFVFPIKTRSPVVLGALPALTTDQSPKQSAASLVASQKTSVTGTTGYILQTKSICFLRPILAFDTRLGYFLFGECVSVTLYEGQFAYVTTERLSGWIDGRDISYNKEAVMPMLVSKKSYTADDIETVTIRQWLMDECDGGSLYLSLQSIEFVMYQLRARGVEVSWPELRPRNAGLWQTLLKGRSRVHISIEPKTASVMEYYTDGLSGVLAFVEAVHPDESIVLQSVGKDAEGEFLIEILTPAQWRELRPVFISFT